MGGGQLRRPDLGADSRTLWANQFLRGEGGRRPFFPSTREQCFRIFLMGKGKLQELQSPSLRMDSVEKTSGNLQYEESTENNRRWVLGSQEEASSSLRTSKLNCTSRPPKGPNRKEGPARIRSNQHDLPRKLWECSLTVACPWEALGAATEKEASSEEHKSSFSYELMPQLSILMLPVIFRMAL